MDPKRKRLLLIGAAVAALIGYLLLRKPSGSSSSTGGLSGAPGTPGTIGDTSGGGMGADSSSQDAQNLLGALQAENQGLLSSLIAATASLGGFKAAPLGAGDPTVSESSGTVTSAFSPATASTLSASPGGGVNVGTGSAPATVAGGAPLTPTNFVSEHGMGGGTGPSDVGIVPGSSPAFGAVPANELGAIQQAAAYTGGAPTELAPNLYQPEPGPISLPDNVSGEGSYTPPPSPPVYGITYGPPAGERASSTPKQGVISVH